MLRLNGKRVAGLRLNGKNALARLNGKVAFSAGLRKIEEEWNEFGGRWKVRSDPAATTALPVINGGNLQAGIPDGLWSGKPAQSVWSVAEVDNRVGTWEVRLGTATSTAGLYSGIILGCDSMAGRMLVVEFDRNNLIFRYRTGHSNSWVTLGSNSSFRLNPADRIRAERTIDTGGTARVRVYQNDVLRNSWVDTTSIPGGKLTPFVGVRLQGDRNFFTTQRSASIAEFNFTAG